MAMNAIDDSALSAFAVPGWEAQARQFISLVTVLASSAPTSQVHGIEREIQSLQRETSGWLISFYSLAQDDPHVRFYGALTLTIKINTQWETLSSIENGPAIILHSLRSRYVQLTNSHDHALVLRKLASSLAAYCLQPASEWDLPVRDLLARFAQSCGSSEVEEGPVAEIWPQIGTLTATALRSLLWFSSTWIEEVVKFDAKTMAGAKVYERAARNSQDAWHLVHALIESVHRRSGTANIRSHENHNVVANISNEDLIGLAKESISTALVRRKPSLMKVSLLTGIIGLDKSS